MASVADLLRAPQLEGLQLAAGPSDGRPLSSVLLVEQPAALEHAPTGSVCVLSAAASRIESYRLDMCLRAAGAAGVAAVAIYSVDGRPPLRSAQMIAERTGTALLTAPAAVDPGTLCIAAQRVVDGDASLWLARVAHLQEVLARLPADASPEEIVEAAAGVVGRPVALAEPPPDADALTPDVVAPAGRPAFRVETDGVLGPLVANLCASAATRRADALRRDEEAPIRSRAGLLAELLLGSRADAAEIGAAAREVGVAIDGWHVATRIDVFDDGQAQPDPVAVHAQREEVFRAALRAARSLGGGGWNGTQLRGGVVLVSTVRDDPGSRSAGETVQVVRRVVERLRSRWPELRFAAGVGGPHEGPEGVQASAAEAAAAAALARSGPRSQDVVGFDAVGLRRMLLSWSATEAAQSAVDDLLAPLDALGGAKADSAIRTLAAFLGEQGSFVRAGERLHLHRNAVAYRIRRISSLLAADLTNPDDRFALELACRARLTLGAGEPVSAH